MAKESDPNIEPMADEGRHRPSAVPGDPGPDDMETHLTLPDNWFRTHGLFGAFEMISKWVRQGLFSACREGMDLRYREIDLVLTLRMRPRSDGETEWPENIVSEERAKEAADRVTWINRKLKERSAE